MCFCLVRWILCCSPTKRVQVIFVSRTEGIRCGWSYILAVFLHIFRSFCLESLSFFRSVLFCLRSNELTTSIFMKCSLTEFVNVKSIQMLRPRDMGDEDRLIRIYTWTLSVTVELRCLHVYVFVPEFSVSDQDERTVVHLLLNSKPIDFFVVFRVHATRILCSALCISFTY